MAEWLAGIAPGVQLFDDGASRPGFATVTETAAKVPTWLEQVRRQVGALDVATAVSGMYVTGPVVAFVTGALMIRGRAHALTPDTVLLRRGPGGWVDGVVVPAGPAGPAGPTEDDIGTAAAGLVAVVTPLLAAHEATGRLGPRGMWANSVGDRILETGTHLVRAGVVPYERLERAHALLAAVAARAPVKLPMPEVQEVPHRGIDHPFARKSACCLMYRSMPEPRTPRAYCTSCPLIDDDLRAPRWLAHLDAST